MFNYLHLSVEMPFILQIHAQINEDKDIIETEP